MKISLFLEEDHIIITGGIKSAEQSFRLGLLIHCHSCVMIQGRLRTHLSVNVDLLYLMRVPKSHSLISESK